ncbi:MAG: SurA N-terminal domain-containing protein [Bacteroidota bacterium]
MALIGKIRDKSGLLLIVVGLAMLAFIMSGWDSMFGGGAGSYGIGKIYGEEADIAKYNELAESMRNQDAMQAEQSQREYTEKDQEMSEDKAWGSYVESVILQKEFDALGIDCSDKELDAYLYGQDGFTVMPDLAQNFADSITGQFNPKLLEKRIEEMESSADAQVSQQWEQNKLQLREARKNEKYFQILSQGVYVTKLEAKEEYKAQKEVKNISFVFKRYSEIPDEEIKVTDEMVRKFYEEHKNEKEYEATAGRDVKFFDVLIQPNKADSTKFTKMMDKVKREFMTAKNDSLFAIANSEDPNKKNMKAFLPYRSETDPNAKPGMTYPQYMDTVFKSASAGQIVGPYNFQGKIYVAKIKYFNNQLLSARHILLSANKADTMAAKRVKRTADSLAAMINKDNFEEYVMKFSQDPGSQQKGGKYEDFAYDEFVPEFSKFVSNGKVGQIGVVQSSFGYHIIEILGKKEAKIPVLSVVDKSLIPSPETEMEINDKVHNLLYSMDSKISRKKTAKEKIELFDSLAQKNGYFSRPIRIMDEKPKVQGFQTSFASDKILKLAYDEEAQVGDLCSAPIKDQGKYIIAMVTSIREKGVPNYEDVEERMRYEVMKEQKAKRFVNMMINEKSLEALARKMNTPVMKGEVTFANPQIPNASYEPEIVGSLFSALKDGQKTVPLKGEQGVYVIQITKTIKAPSAANYNAERDQLLSNARAQMQGATKAAFMKLADVKDNRKFSALGIIRE